MAKVASKTAAKPAPKKAAKPARSSKKRVKEGEKYSCDVCGLVVSVDEACDCVDACDIMCCGEQMKPEK